MTAAHDRRTEQHRLSVCVTCRSAAWRPGTPREGRLLFGLIASFLRSWSQRDKLALYGVECLSNCARPCAIALSADGKDGYEFGDLLPTEETAEAVLATVERYVADKPGELPEADLPATLRRGLIAHYPYAAD